MVTLQITSSQRATQYERTSSIRLLICVRWERGTIEQVQKTVEEITGEMEKVDDSAKASCNRFQLLITSSVMLNAIYVPGGEKSIAPLQGEADALNFINEAYQHCKSLAVTGAGVELLRACRRWSGRRPAVCAKSIQPEQDKKKAQPRRKIKLSSA